MVVIFEHGSQLVNGGILVVEGCICISSPKFAQDPLPRFASTIPVILSVLMRFFQKQDTNHKPKQDHGSAEQVRKKVRVRLKDGTLENMGPLFGRSSENTAKESADDGPTKWRSVAYKTKVSGETHPRHQTKGIME